MSMYLNAVGDIVFREASLGDSIPQADALTAAGWLKIVSDINAGTAIFERYGNAAGTIWQGIYIDSTGTAVRVNNSAGSASASTEVGVGVWVHVAYVRSGATHTIFLNGVSVGTSTGTPAADVTTSFALGGNGVTNTGDLEFSEWRIWEAALSAAELTAERFSAAPVRTSGLWADYQFAPDALTTDSSGNARTLRTNGTVENGASEPSLPVRALPNADVSDGTWTPSTGADNYAVLADANSGTHSSTNSNSTLRVGLTALGTPDAGSQVVRINAAGSLAKRLLVRLIEAASTVRGSTTIDPLSPTLTTYTFNPSGVVDFADLDVEIEVQDATTPPTASVTFGAIGAGASGTTSCTPSYPTGINALTSKLYCVVTGRSNTANTAPTMPAGWTNILDFEGGTGTWGVDAGTRRVTVFRKDTVAGSETGTVTVSLGGTTNNTLRASIIRVEVPSGYSISEVVSTGADTTSGTAFSATGSTNIDFAANDLLLIAVAQAIDSATQSAQSITATGITFGTRTNRASTAVTNGNDHRHIIDTVPVSSGSGTVAPTYAYTASAAASGPVGFLRLRAVAPTEFARVSELEFERPGTVDTSITLTTSINAAIQASRNISSSLNLAIQTANTLSTSINTAVAQKFNVQTTITAAVRDTKTLTSQLNTAIRVSNSSAQTINLAIRLSRSVQTLIDAVIRQNRTASVTVNTVIQRALNSIANIDLAISVAHSLSTQINLMIQAVTNATFSINLQIQVPSALSVSIDAAIRSLRSASTSLNTGISNKQSATSQLDTAIRQASNLSLVVNTGVLTNRSATTSINSVISLSRFLISQLQLAVSQNKTSIINTDIALSVLKTAIADINLGIQSTKISNLQLDSAILTGKLASTSINTVIKQLQSLSTQIDLLVKGISQLEFSINLQIQVPGTLSTLIDVLIRQNKSINLPIDLALQLSKTNTLNISTAIEADKSLTSNIDVPIRSSYTTATAVNVAIQTAKSVNTTISTVIAQLKQSQVNLDMQIQAGFTRSSLIDLAISRINQVVTVIDTAISLSTQVSTIIDTVIQRHNSIIFEINALIRARRAAISVLSIYIDDGSNNIPSPNRTYIRSKRSRVTDKLRDDREISSKSNRTYKKPSR